MTRLHSFALAAALAMNYGLASANVVYEYSESFSGTFSLSPGGSSITRTEDTALVSDSSNLPSWLQTALQQTIGIVTILPTGPEYCLNAGDCTISGSNAGGTYQGTFTIYYYRELENDSLFEFAGNFNFTGGTGVYAGITGSGSLSGTDTYLNALSGLTEKKVQAAFSLPVPEPEGWAMMLAGVALIGAAARRQQA